jgi:DNA polymerase III epsilon subunit-like protein
MTHELIERTSLIDLGNDDIPRPNVENSSLRYQSGARSRERTKAHLLDRPEARKFLKYTPTVKMSNEQDTYVRWPLLEHNVLSAPPGSGKTRCQLERARCLVKNKLIAKEDFIFISFSAAAAAEAKERAASYEDYNEWIVLDNIITIDAMSRKILISEGNHKANNVELLTLTLTNLLEERTRSEVRRTTFIAGKRYVIVDEAQDIDKKQFRIICNFADKLNATISMAADPNQALYRFRGGSDRYMFQFQSRYHAREFHLTLNYRSSANIVNFFKGFRSMIFHDIVATKPAGEPVRVIIRHRKTMHNWLIAFLNKQKNLEEIAILCPTKGTGAVKDVGLSSISNLLHSNNIGFVQHYSEANTDDVQSRSRRSTKGKVNLVTYIASKGLEWRTVIMMDFHALLYNRMPQSMEEYWDQRNLLYVGCSRAMDRLIICAYKNKAIHPWIARIDPSTYICDSGSLESHGIFPMGRKGNPQVISEISQIVDKLSPEVLDAIHGLMNISVIEKRLVKDRTDISKGEDEYLISTFSREVLLMQIAERLKQPRKKYIQIESLLNSHLIILHDRDHSKVRSFLSRNKTMTWEQFHSQKNIIPADMFTLISTQFNMKIDFGANMISTDEAKKILDENRDIISDNYNKYINAKDWHDALHPLFYLIVVMQCIETGHYYHMNNSAANKSLILTSFIGMIVDLDIIAKLIVKRGGVNIEQSYTYNKLGISGRSDIVVNDNLIDIRCGMELYIKHYIQILLANFCWKGNFKSRSWIINPIKGVEYMIDLSVSSADMWKILNLVSDKCNLKFNNLHLIYDLETTGLITSKNGKQVMPEIIQISIRDYDTGMIVYNYHNRPVNPVSDFICKLVNVNAEMLASKPDISKTKSWLATQLRNVFNVTMYAHNGIYFDAAIMKHYNLIPSTIKIEWKDTIAIIRSHYNGSLKSYSLGNVYQAFFNEPILAQHTALADVDALIRILRHLGVKL